MIVHCDQCKSKFRLDDAKVKDAGVKVRCSKCRHIFMVFPETTREGSEFDDLLREFGPAGGVGEPPEQEDTFSFTDSFTVQPQEPNDSPEDVPQGSAADQPGTESTGYTFDDSSFADNTVEQATQDVEFSAAEYSPKEEFDFSSLLDEAPLKAEEVDRQGVQGLDVFENLGFAPDNSEAVADEPAVNPYPDVQEGDVSESVAAPSIAVSMAQEDEGGDIWRDAGSETAVPEFGDAFTATAVEEEADNGVGKDISREEAIPGEQSRPIAELPSLPASGRRRQHSIFPLIVTVISIIFVLLLAAGGLLLMKDGPKLFERMGLGFLPQWVGLQVEDDGKISVRGMTGAFMMNKEAGEIFVVTGEAVNGFKKPRAGIQVRAILYGPKGNVVGRRVAYCGNMLTVEQLQTLPIAKIESIMNNQFGDSLSNLGVAPGKGIPFVVVFTKVPDNAVDYGVEIAGSTVAGK